MKYLLSIIVLILAFAAGYGLRGCSVETVQPDPVEGVVTVEELEAGMQETPPDTVFVLVEAAAKKDKGGHDPQTSDTPIITRVPIADVLPGIDLDMSLNLTVADWNTKRSYSGTFFDDDKNGTFTYAFDVQYNRAGQINYKYDPAPVQVLREPRRFRPWAGGTYFTNGQYSFDAGVQRGAFMIGVGALKLYNADGYAFGINTRILF